MGFANAHVFEPNLSPEEMKSRPVPEMQRLSTLYNADVGLYMLANKVVDSGKDVCFFTSAEVPFSIDDNLLWHFFCLQNPGLLWMYGY